jgi:hypothetical protein
MRVFGFIMFGSGLPGFGLHCVNEVQAARFQPLSRQMSEVKRFYAAGGLA